MNIVINGKLPRFDEIDGVPEEFLLPSQDEPEQLNISTTKFQQVQTTDKREKECFRKAFDFLAGHRNPKTLEDFIAISREMGKCGGQSPDPLLKGLLKVCFDELERQFLARPGVKENGEKA